MPERTCQRPGCGRPIPSRKRRDARWCSRSCESKARRATRRRADFEDANPHVAELLRAESRGLADLYDRAAPPQHWAGQVDDVQDDEDEDACYGTDPEWAGHDGRINTMLQDDTDQRTPKETWHKWRSYGRRHGTEHLEQTADRVERHRAAERARVARIDSLAAGQVQNRHDPRTGANVALRGAGSRRLNIRHAEQPPMPARGYDFRGEPVSGGPCWQGRSSGQRAGHADYAWSTEDGFRY